MISISLALDLIRPLATPRPPVRTRLIDGLPFRRISRVMYRVPLVFTPQAEGRYTVTSPVLPELLTEGDSLEEAQAHVRDAFEAVIELYAEQGRPLPSAIFLPAPGEPLALPCIGCRHGGS